MLLGLFFAVCGTFSLACGLLVWPILLFVCVLERASLATYAAIVGIGVPVWVFYFWGYYSPPDLADPQASLAQPLSVLAFAFTYLVNVSPYIPSRLATILGLCSFSVGAMGFGIYVRRRVGPMIGRSDSFFVYLAIFIVATAFVTALGRINFGISQAVVSRYRTPTLIFWAAILGGGCSWWSEIAGYTGRLFDMPLVAILFLAIFILPAQEPSIETLTTLTNQIKRSSIALAFEATDEAPSWLFRLRPDLVRRYTPFLRDNHLSIFADRLFAARGQPLTALFASRSARECSGSVDELKDFGGRSKIMGAVFGWGWIQSERRGAQTVVLADDTGAIVGLATGMGRRPDVAAIFHNNEMLYTGWSGYFRAEPTARRISAYAILSDGKSLCPLGQVSLCQ
jgi:hypothetical protein